MLQLVLFELTELVVCLLLVQSCVDLGLHVDVLLVFARLIVVEHSIRAAGCSPGRLHTPIVALVELFLHLDRAAGRDLLASVEVVVNLLSHVEHPSVVCHLLLALGALFLEARVLWLDVWNTWINHAVMTEQWSLLDIANVIDLLAALFLHLSRKLLNLAGEDSTLEVFSQLGHVGHFPL